MGDCRRTGRRTAHARTQTAAHSGAPITEFSKKLQERKGQGWQVSGEGNAREKSKGPGAGMCGRLESGEARGLSAMAAPTHGGADGQGTC